MFEQNDTPKVALQPMGFSDILDGIFTLYRNHFRLFFGILAVYLIAAFCLNLLFKLSGLSPADVPMSMFLFNLFAILFVFILVTAGTYVAGAQCYLGRQITPSAALRQALRRFLPYFCNQFLWLLAVGGLAVTIIGIPFAIYLGNRWSLYSMPVLFEEKPVREAFRRSSQLIKGTWWRVFGITLAIFLLWMMLLFILKATMDFAFSFSGIVTREGDLWQWLLRMWTGPDPFKTSLLSYAAQMFLDVLIATFTAPILTIGYMLLYFDLRIRKEGFDIEMMARSEQTGSEQID